MKIWFYKRLTTNPEIGNTPAYVLQNIWRLTRVRDTKFGTNVSNEMLLNDAKCQDYSFYCFSVIKGTVEEGGGETTPPHTHTHAYTYRLVLMMIVSVLFFWDEKKH